MLITQAEAREALQGVSGDLAEVASLIDRTDAIFASWCRFPPASEVGNPTLEQTTYTRYFRGPGGRRLLLDVWPVVSITSIEDDPTEEFDGSSYLVGAGDYVLRERGEVLLKQSSTHGAWSRSDHRVIKVVWDAGLPVSNAPEDIRQAAIEYVGLLWQAKTTLGVEGISVGGGGVVTTRTPEIPDHIKQKLQRLRIIPRSGVLP